MLLRILYIVQSLRNSLSGRKVKNMELVTVRCRSSLGTDLACKSTDSSCQS